ncbi:MAG: hypothetical protein U1E76_04145 [Planctomycetota bacterium]
MRPVLGSTSEQRVLEQALARRPARFGRPASHAGPGHAACCVRLPAHKRDVTLLDAVFRELLHEMLMRGSGARHDDRSGRVAIEPVHEAEAAFAAELHLRIAVAADERVHERVGAVADAWLHRQPRRLRDHQHRRVLVQHRQAQPAIGHRRRLRCEPGCDLELSLRRHHVATLRQLAAHSHALLAQQLLGVFGVRGLEQRAQHLLHLLPGELCRHGEVLGGRFGRLTGSAC